MIAIMKYLVNMMTIAIGVLLFVVGLMIIKTEITTGIMVSRAVEGGVEVWSMIPMGILLLGSGIITFIAGVRLDRYDN